MAIKKCTCNNDYMDQKYGDKMRVMNKTEKTAGINGSQPVYRCTNCKKETT